MKSLEEKRIKECEYVYNGRDCRTYPHKEKLKYYYKEEDVTLVVAELRKEIDKIKKIVISDLEHISKGLEQQSPKMVLDRCSSLIISTLLVIEKKMIVKKLGCEKPIGDVCSQSSEEKEGGK